MPQQATTLPADERPIWVPDADRQRTANLTSFMREVSARWNIPLANYAALYQWSIDHPEQFWVSMWDYGNVIGETRTKRVLVNGQRMPGARFFPDARLNFAENLLRRREDSPAIISWSEDGQRRRLTHAQLYAQVMALAAALRAAGVVRGDRIAGILPNIPETVVAALASATLGAIWSSCSPDFGVEGVVDRFGQIQPRILFCADGYFYGGKRFDSLERAAQIAARLPSVQRLVVIPFTAAADTARVPNAVALADFWAGHVGEQVEFVRLPFNHPLYILYSSGTTGAPKCIVHGAGGTLIQHLKEHLLHSDEKPGDRLFYFTTCGWMMWNWLVSGLAAGSSLMLYDGSPFHPGPHVLFDYIDKEGITHFGTSAKYIGSLSKAGVVPMRTHRLDSLRAILSTGSPLMPESFDYVYGNIKRDVCLSSISGGTDIISCFALGNPLLPVWRGELQCRGLGLNVQVFDAEGRPMRGEKGELVCTAPFPSMPVGFWDDPQGKKYHAAYFERFPGVWCHGDWVELTAHDGMIIYGRSDAVLNPGGVRIGTAEIYRQVEQIPELVEALVIGQDWQGDVRIILFVRLREGVVLDDALSERIRRRIRDNTSPRHVPAKILQVPDIPRTKSGKLVELAVRNVVHGRANNNLEALANPEALEHFCDRPELRR